MSWVGTDRDLVEIPNVQVRDCAQDFRSAAIRLFERGSCLLSYYVLSAFAIELYLKSLNSKTVHHPMGPPESSTSFTLSARAVILGHRLNKLFDGLYIWNQNDLADIYSAQPAFANKVNIRDALLYCSEIFDKARYPYENPGLLYLPEHKGFLTLVNMIGNYVDNLTKTFQIEPKQPIRSELDVIAKGAIARLRKMPIEDKVSLLIKMNLIGGDESDKAQQILLDMAKAAEDPPPSIE